MLRPTVPVPVPDAPDVTVIHGAALDAVQAHDAPVVTVTVVVLAPDTTSWLVGAIEYVQGATKAAWFTVKV
jgi:hypothetical protein